MRWGELSLAQWLWYWLLAHEFTGLNPARTLYFCHAYLFICFFVTDFVRKVIEVLYLCSIVSPMKPYLKTFWAKEKLLERAFVLLVFSIPPGFLYKTLIYVDQNDS